MSGPERPESAVPTTRALKRKHLSEDDQHELDALDGIFKRIKNKVPRTPYILSTPSLHPYRYHSQQEANAWTMGRLWRHDEEHKQYRTYLYREPSCQDCFELQAGEEDEPEPERERAKAPSNADGQPVKKKVNLSTFKVKQASSSVASSTKTASPNLAPSKHGSDQANGVNSVKQSSSVQKERVKSHELLSTRMIDGKTNKDGHREKPLPTSVRKRASSQNSEPGKSRSVETSDTSNGTPHGLPRILSPVPMPNPYGLPNILSPTLPANVQAELDRLDEKRKQGDSNLSAPSSGHKTQSLAVVPTVAQKLDGVQKSEGRTRSVSMNGKSPKEELEEAADEEDSSLVVKLKFSKTKAPTVKQILKLPPKRSSLEKKDRQNLGKESTKDEPPKIEGPVIKKKPAPKGAARRAEVDASIATPNITSKSTTTTTRVLDKRPRPEDDIPSNVASKRPRTLSNQDQPATPAQPLASSPAPSVKSALQKSQAQHTTPKKEAKAVNMLRTISTESYDITPGRSGGTPAGTKPDARTGPTSNPSNNKKSADISLLAQTSMKLNQMGRALKHEATKILTNAAKKLTKQDEKRAAVTNLECILSYMAAYYAQDYSLNLRGRPGEVEQTWKTLLPLCLSYARSTKDFQHLDGLRSYLSCVIASAICTHVSQRASNNRAHDSPQDMTSAELAKQHATVTENFALLADHTLKMNRHYQDARMALPLDDLQSVYKKTYAARETNIKLAREPEKISGTRMAGPYFLPLSSDTTPIQAVRFGLKFLAEYCEKERLEYSFRVNLDKPE